MRTTRLLAIALSLAVLGSSIAYAQQRLPAQPAKSESQPQHTVRIAIKPIQPLANPRTLVGRSVTDLPGGQKIVQERWTWNIPGTPKITAPRTVQKAMGSVQVIRTYEPKGDHTAVEQTVLTLPRMPRTEAERAGYALQGVMEMVKRGYVDPVDEAKIYRDAMRGVANGLDRHTTYFSPEEWGRFTTTMSGSMVGIGVMMKGNQKDGSITVQRVFQGSPAFRAGMRKGDRLMAVDGKPLAAGLDETLKTIKGEEGTTVKVTVERQGKKLELPIVRSSIDTNKIRTRLTPQGVGVVRLPEFDAGAAEKVAGAIEKLTKRNGGKLSGLVLDLRNNPGGALTEATALLNYFVREGTLVTTKGRGDQVRDLYKADPSKVRWPDLPMAVLVNGHSASASELVSGTLKDLGRATVVGSKSYGKGSVQQAMDLPDGSGIKVTMAHYFTAGGTTPDKVGITPQVDAAAAKAGYQARRSPNDRRRIVDYVLDEAIARVLQPAPAK